MKKIESKTFVVSDLHGMGNAYSAMFKDVAKRKVLGRNVEQGFIDMSKDRLIILGDVIDRGTDGLEILQDIIKRKDRGENISFIIGNHESMLLQTLNLIWSHDFKMSEVEDKIIPYITTYYQTRYLQRPDARNSLTQNEMSQLTRYNSLSSYMRQKGINDVDDLMIIQEWLMLNNGLETYRQFLSKKPEEQFRICEFLEESSAQMLVREGKNDFVLAHACPIYDQGFINMFRSNGVTTNYPYKSLKDHSRAIHQLVCHRNDLDSVSQKERQHMIYYKNDNITPIVGHSPHLDRVVYDERTGSYNIDAGCGHDGGKCAVFDLTDGIVYKIDPHTGKIFKPKSVDREVVSR